jgi:Zn-finger domain-containing protein
MLQKASSSENLVYERVRQLAVEELAEIERILHKMQIVEAELIQQLALAEQLIKQEVKQPKILTGDSSRDRYALKFPFEGEVWFDELSNYKIDLKGGCQAKVGLNK